jgi:hypothetical protein
MQEDQWNFTSWHKFRSLHASSAKEEIWRYAVVVAHDSILTTIEEGFSKAAGICS